MSQHEHPSFAPTVVRKIEPELPYSSRIRRVASNCIDSPLFIAGAACVVVDVGVFSLWFVFTVLKAAFYLSTRSTPGRVLTKQSVFDLETGTPTLVKRLSLRSLAHMADFFSVIGWFMPLWDSKNQTFADKIMNTVVLREDLMQPANVVRVDFTGPNPENPEGPDRQAG